MHFFVKHLFACVMHRFIFAVYCKSYISLCWSNRYRKVLAKAEPIKDYTDFFFLCSSITAVERMIYARAKPISKNFIIAIAVVTTEVKAVAEK